MNRRDMLKDTLINSFNYHDGEIIEFKKDGFDYILKFKDGWVDNQVNEIRFQTARVLNNYDLTDRVIYQLGNLDFVEANSTSYIYFFEIFVWYERNLVEVVKVEASNILSKKYFNNELVKEEDLGQVLFSK
jgi:hypothetical protein